MKTRVLAAAVIVALSVTIAACGSSPKGGLTPSTGTLGSTTSPQDQGAGTVASVTPQGTILADNGFRPNPNGFGFQNYGDNLSVDGSGGKPTNLTPAELQDIFGTQVCASGSGSSCQLIPTAQAWLQQENQGMGGGHCFGFSVTALRFYDGNLKVSDFGSAPNAFGLSIPDNGQLQATIARNFVGQSLPLEKQGTIQGTPNDVLNKLITTLKDKSEYYTIGIIKRDGGGGHAVTPYAVVDKGNGQKGILIYDNNFPGVSRQILVDTNADTWSYDGGPNPADTNEHYEGDATTKSMFLLPLNPIEQQNPCPFCNGENVSSSSAQTGSVLGAAQQYNQITLQGDPANHGHVVLTDKEGHQSGFINGKEVNDIPGVQIQTRFANADWAEAPEPVYDVPVKTDVNVTIDGTSLKRPDTETIDLIGPGDYN